MLHVQLRLCCLILKPEVSKPVVIGICEVAERESIIVNELVEPAEIKDELGLP